MKSFLALLLIASAPCLAQTADMTVRELYGIMVEREKANAQRFDAQEKAVAAALAAAKEAVLKAEVSNDKRFESVNEFRNTLKDQQGTYVTRTELYAWVVGGGGLLLSIMTFIMRKQTTRRV